MDRQARKRALIDSLKHLTPEMRERLNILKEEGSRELARPDFVWHLLLQSFATWGGTRGHIGLIGNQANYSRVTFGALSILDANERLGVISEVFQAAKINRPYSKAPLMTRNYDIVAEMGGPEEAKRKALAQEGTRAKIAFMERFHGIGPKFARNIWMDAYHPDFRDTIAIDDRIKRVTTALGYSFGPNEYEQHERFYQDIAREAWLQGWELDRLLYGFRDHFLAVIAADSQY